MTIRPDAAIKTHDVPQCPMCTTMGSFIYQDQSDHLFGVPGSFSLKQCNNQNCNLIWLDPTVDVAEIGKLYQNYYTHDNQVSSMIGSGSPARRNFKKAMFTQALGYRWADQDPGITAVMGGLLARNRYHRERLERSVMWLSPRHSHGIKIDEKPHLLDIGCGSGDFMVSMQEMNWQVHGVEPDDLAAEIGRNDRSLDITTGVIEEVDLPKNYYDALTMSHVIEHLPHPLSTLTEAFSLLKPGGKLAVVTPNNQSLIHGLTKENWRGLEIPRHLQVFALQSLTDLITKVGFTVEISRTYSGTAASLWARSRAIKNRRQFPDENPNDAHGRHFKKESKLIAAWEFFLTGWPLRRPAGEELVVVGRK